MVILVTCPKPTAVHHPLTPCIQRCLPASPPALHDSAQSRKPAEAPQPALSSVAQDNPHISVATSRLELLLCHACACAHAPVSTAAAAAATHAATAPVPSHIPALCTLCPVLPATTNHTNRHGYFSNEPSTTPPQRQPQTLHPTSTQQLLCRCMHTFEPTELGELAFEKGEIICAVNCGYKD